MQLSQNWNKIIENMNFAIIGATGNVGRKTIEVLEKSRLEIDTLFLVASEKSAGQKLIFKKKEISLLWGNCN